MVQPTRVLVALVLAAAAPASSAHDTWIAPRQSEVGVGAAIDLDFTSGSEFPKLDQAIQSERVERAGLRLGNMALPLGERTGEAHALRLRAASPKAGLAAVWVQLSPKQIDLAAAEVGHYLDEIGAAPGSIEAWNRQPEPRVWHETYRKHAKTFVRVGGFAKDDSWRKPLGLTLEIVPESDPTSLRAGDELSLRVLKDGRPLGELAIAAVHAGAGRTLGRTDAEGLVRFRLEHAGPWLFSGVDLRPPQPDATAPWESDFTTLTLVVQAPAAR